MVGTPDEKARGGEGMSDCLSSCEGYFGVGGEMSWNQRVVVEHYECT